MSARPRIAVKNAQRCRQVNPGELQQFSEDALLLVLLSPPKTRSDLRNLDAVTVVLVSDRRMAALHRKFMGLEGATDVIAFQDGDIFVSVETAQRNASRFGLSFKREIKLCIVHGLLHLHGFMDKTAAQTRWMGAAQRRILAAADDPKRRARV